jgi:hypothetical protein
MMERNKLSAITMIAVILGAAGLGAGAYSVISVQTGAVKGDDGDDGDDGASGITTITYITENEYHCSTEAEINNALDAIGTGNGKIMITEDITLTSPIQIDGGGSYIIQGTGLSTIDCGGDRTAFNITDATACTIRDLKIDSSDGSQTTRIININEISDNPIYIDEVQFIGDNFDGYGIYIESENIWVSGCYFYCLYNGIYITTTGNKAHIFSNTIVLSYYGIYSLSDYCVFEGNYHYSGDRGIQINGTYNTVANNIIFNVDRKAIAVGTGDYNTITGNVITKDDFDSDFYDDICICIECDADNNTVVGNGCFDNKNFGFGDGYGIWIKTTNCDYNTIVGNTCLNNDINFLDDGTNTFGNETLNNFG